MNAIAPRLLAMPIASNLFMAFAGTGMAPQRKPGHLEARSCLPGAVQPNFRP